MAGACGHTRPVLQWDLVHVPDSLGVHS